MYHETDQPPPQAPAAGSSDPAAPTPPPVDATGAPTPAGGAPGLAARFGALFEVVLCSDYPTQLAIAAGLALAGFQPFGANGLLQLPYVAALSIIDAVVLVGLILLLLRAHGERPRDVLLGSRAVGRELLLGIPLAAVALAIGVGLLLLIQWLVPSLHNVKVNPLEGLIRTPFDAALFGLVTLVAGGLREEIQRAFILHRFERYLGGPVIGIVVASIGFGAGHIVQGWDAVVTTATLGAFWGVVYLRRRSIAAPAVSHAGFDLVQIAQYVLFHH
ncbi:MAG: CPBP family intramembrane metalloprotease [Acidobacteriota bacterium]|nr:CPBP family intramembrane metalloprotease [Acidobacteriota bacterium]